MIADCLAPFYIFFMKSKELEHTIQIQPLPLELFNRIFSLLNIQELGRLNRTCKDWKCYTKMNLKVLQQEVDYLYENLDSECMIARDLARLFSPYVHHRFNCAIINHRIKIVSWEENQALHFFLQAKILNLHCNSIEDSALNKSMKTFFRTGKWINFSCTLIQKIKPIFSNHIDEENRKHIKKICRTLNYLFHKV